MSTTMPPLSSPRRRCADGGRRAKQSSPALDPSAPSFHPPSRHRPLQYHILPPPPPPMLVRARFPHHQAWIYHHPHYLAGYYNLRRIPLHYHNPLHPPIRHEDKPHLHARPSKEEVMPRPTVPPSSLENNRWIRRKMNGRGFGEVSRSGPTIAPGTATQAKSSFCGLSSGVTTIMIRNLPNVFRREDLLDILDKHCREVNSKLDEAVDDAAASWEQTVRSEYDFVYLPIDFRHNMNLGYAFVNFTTPIAAARMFHEFHGWEWKGYWYEARRCTLVETSPFDLKA